MLFFLCHSITNKKDVTTNSYAFHIIYLGFFFPVNAGFFFFGAFGFVSTNDPLNISCFVNTIPSFFANCSNLRSSCGVTRDTTVPSLPIRPVRPER
ncbi:hypothetical protein protein [Bacillus cereus G9241]|nr:hypothetical protein protein [Bacillus cereus G9241]